MMVRLTNREVEMIADGYRAPEAKDVWRDRRGWERHILTVSPANIRYIQVIFGRENVQRNCLPGVWERWARKNGAKFVCKCG